MLRSIARPRRAARRRPLLDGQIFSERYQHLAEARPEDALPRPEAIAESYWHLHTQPRSAWTLELDLRPWVEKF